MRMYNDAKKILRMVAAMAVLFFYVACERSALCIGVFGKPFFNVTWLGQVDIVFVVSGFIKYSVQCENFRRPNIGRRFMMVERLFYYCLKTRMLAQKIKKAAA